MTQMAQTKWMQQMGTRVVVGTWHLIKRIFLPLFETAADDNFNGILQTHVFSFDIK